MIAATVAPATTGTSAFDLINTATPDQLGALFTGRVAEVHIQWLAGVSHLVYKSGAVVLTTDSGYMFDNVDGKREYVLRATSHNQISLKDIYLAGATGGGADTVRISAYTI